MICMDFKHIITKEQKYQSLIIMKIYHFIIITVDMDHIIKLYIQEQFIHTVYIRILVEQHIMLIIIGNIYQSYSVDERTTFCTRVVVYDPLDLYAYAVPSHFVTLPLPVTFTDIEDK